MTAEWVWDDPNVPDNDEFLRRVPRKPDFAVPDLVTRKMKILPGALQIDPGSGMSVSSSRVLGDEGFDRKNLCNWNTHTVVEFPASAARVDEQAGVILDPVDGHPAGDELGKAHALVRAPVPHPDREMRRNIQATIAARCRWVDEDPSKPPPPGT